MSIHGNAILPGGPITGNPDWGTVSGPVGGTKIIASPSGFEQRMPYVSNSGRDRFRAARTLMTDAEAHTLEVFGMCRNGAMHSFLFKDPRDFTNHQDGTSDGSGVSDQIIIGAGTGTRVLFNLFKFYLSGDAAQNQDYQREVAITRPIKGTIRVYVGGSLQDEDDDYVLDYSSGQIRFLLAAPPIGQDVTWSGEFYKPVRFGEQVDEWMQIRNVHTTRSSVSIDMVQVVDRLEGREDVRGEGFLDGGQYSGVVDLRYEDGQVQYWEPTAASPLATNARLRLFALDSVTHGGPHVVIYNKSAIHPMRIHAKDDSVVGFINPLQSAQFWYDPEGPFWRLA